MKTVLLLVCCLFTGILGSKAQFSEYFLEKSLRFDYYHCGDSKTEEYYFDELKEEPYWGGSKTNLIDDMGYGNQMFKIIDKASGKEIFRKGFNTLFAEWQSTDESRTVRKAMPESVVFPYPKDTVIIELYSRNRKGVFQKKFSQEIDPFSPYIRKFTPRLESFDVAYNGNPDHRIDIVLLPEGYNAGERARFEEACRQFARQFFSFSPYKDYKDRFNIRAVWAPSAESGVSLPGENIWKNTALKAQFYTFGSERYQMVEDFQNVRDIAGHAPYDYIYILSNTQKYGGGAIYNFYGISAAHHPSATDKIYVHEFGHLFMGLADEYEGNVNFEDMYNNKVEPWAENATALIGLDGKDWKKLIDKDTPIPTPKTPEYKDKVGAFEGCAYMSKGMYRPCQTCLMREFTTDRFCPVCTQAIVKYIRFLCK